MEEELKIKDILTRKDVVMKIYCNTCGMDIDEDTLIAQFSDSEPGCPICGNNDFSDVQTEEEWHDEMMGEIQRHGG